MVIAFLAVVGGLVGLWSWGGRRGANERNGTISDGRRDGGPGPRAADAGLAKLPPSGPAALRGTVVDASAQAVAGVQITVSPERGTDPAREAETGKDGTFVV